MMYGYEKIREIEERARIFYLNRTMAFGWNENRRGNELRLVTGWTWVERGGQGRSRTGFKTQSAAYRDAYYVLIEHREQPADVASRSKVIQLDAERRRTRITSTVAA